MKLSYIFLSIGITGTLIVACINAFTWIVTHRLSASIFSAAWVDNWLPAYITWLICCALGAVFWVFDSRRIVR